jgi:hypothetical protein
VNNSPARVSIADLYAAQIADLKERSDETDRSIARHLANAKRLAAEALAIDLIHPED